MIQVSNDSKFQDSDLMMVLLKRSWISTAMLFFLLLIYTAGILNILFIMLGGQELDPEFWQLKSLPSYAIVFALGDVSALLTLRWQKIGLQGLFATLILTGVLYALFGPPFPTFGVTFLIFIAITALFLSLFFLVRRH